MDVVNDSIVISYVRECVRLREGHVREHLKSIFRKFAAVLAENGQVDIKGFGKWYIDEKTNKLQFLIDIEDKTFDDFANGENNFIIDVALIKKGISDFFYPGDKMMVALLSRIAQALIENNRVVIKFFGVFEPKGNKKYDFIPDLQFWQIYKLRKNGESFYITGNILNEFIGNEVDITIPDGVIIIKERAFANADIRTVKLPATLRVISAEAFINCVNLQHIDFSEGVESIGRRAFAGCKSLKSIVFPHKMRSVENAFSNILGFVRLPDELEYLDCSFRSYWNTEAFQNQSVITPIGLTSIPEDFLKWTKVKELVIRGSVKSIPKFVCADCLCLERVIVEEGVKSISSSAFELTEPLAEKEKHLEIILPSSVTKIGVYFLKKAIRYGRDVVIKAPVDSYAIYFAKANGIKYEEIE